VLEEMSHVVFMVGSLVGFLAAACSAEAPPPDAEEGSEQLFIGAVDGSDAKIALVRDDAHWIAYVCGGATSLSSLTAWFQGALASGRDDVTAELDEETLVASFAGDLASGTLIKDSTEARSFTAERVTSDVPAGLFQAVTSGCRTGLIVPPPADGAPQGVYCANVAPPTIRLFEQVTPVTPMNPRNSVVRARVLDSQGQIVDLVKVALPLAPL
jgi:hypothetical protein